MDDTLGIGTGWYILACAFWLAVLVVVVRWWLGVNRRYPGLFSRPLLPVTPASGPLADPSDHTFEPLPLTTLTTHMFEAHFESWSGLGERDAAPGAWRVEHAADHGRSSIAKRSAGQRHHAVARTFPHC